MPRESTHEYVGSGPMRFGFGRTAAPAKASADPPLTGIAVDDLSGGDDLRHRKTAGIALRKCEIICKRALQTECAAHQRKRVRGHVCVNVWAESLKMNRLLSSH
jgi:hypothetical protein